jgi:hypothetical protein
LLTIIVSTTPRHEVDHPGPNSIERCQLCRLELASDEKSGRMNHRFESFTHTSVYESGRTRGSEPPRPFRRLNGRHRFATLEA